MKEKSFLSVSGVYYPNSIRKIKKADNKLQPIFEAITNSLEAIKLDDSESSGKITLKQKIYTDTFRNFENVEFLLEDNGIGFTEKEFHRMENLNDNRKGFLNKGTGRIQLIHFFKMSVFKSVFRNSSSKTGFSERCFRLSKSENYLKQNSIIFFDYLKDVEANEPLTELRLQSPLLDKDKKFYIELPLEDLKKQIVTHYLAYLCENRDSLPDIVFQQFIDNKLTNTLRVEPKDIPQIDCSDEFNVFYQVIPKAETKIICSEKTEIFKIKGFKIPKTDLGKNEIFLTSKNEIANKIELECLIENDVIENNRYLFLISGDFFDKIATDVREKLELKNRDAFEKSISDNVGFEDQEEILIDDIQQKANDFIINNYPEIESKNEEKESAIEELKNMFLLNPKTINTLKSKIKVNATDATILKKIYQADADISAKYDADLKHKYELLNKLNPKDNDYHEKLEEEIIELVKSIPLQNRTSLSQYVARRNIVLKVFDKILKRELEKLKNGERIDEDLLHNLIFQQSSDKPEESDLWLINEEFIYFKGFSEKRLYQIKLDGKKIFDKKFSEEEERYLNSLGEKRLSKRPDVLLFPKEGKCIIIEFKAPDVNVSEHITQIDFYANLIRNYTTDQFQITAFYGYLIGEGIEDRDVRGRVTRFEHSYHFDYWFRPSEKVVDFSDVRNGSIYTEIIKYSTLLDRAKLRNQIFIDKLEGTKQK